MSESSARLQAGEAHAGQPCGFCQAALAAEDEAAICAECGSVQHAVCWDRQLGCSKADCINAPLKRFDAPPVAPPVAAREIAEGEGESVGEAEGKPKKKKKKLRACVDCGCELYPGQEICETCFAINTPDGLYHGPKKTSPAAREAFIMSLVGLVLCGPILGPMAISKANSAKEGIRRDPRLGGEGLATAAVVIGVIDLVLWGLSLVSRVAGVH